MQRRHGCGTVCPRNGETTRRGHGAGDVADGPWHRAPGHRCGRGRRRWRRPARPVRDRRTSSSSGGSLMLRTTCRPSAAFG